MQQFKEYLEDEGLPANEERIEFILPVVKNLDGKKLTSIRLEGGRRFQAAGTQADARRAAGTADPAPVTLNWYPKIQARKAKESPPLSDVALLEVHFEEKHLCFMDIDAIWFELQRFKNERAWYNLNLPRESDS